MRAMVRQVLRVQLDLPVRRDLWVLQVQQDQQAQQAQMLRK
jgi:hypothetical protein